MTHKFTIVVDLRWKENIILKGDEKANKKYLVIKYMVKLRAYSSVILTALRKIPAEITGKDLKRGWSYPQRV